MRPQPLYKRVFSPSIGVEEFSQIFVVEKFFKTAIAMFGVPGVNFQEVQIANVTIFVLFASFCMVVNFVFEQKLEKVVSERKKEIKM